MALKLLSRSRSVVTPVYKDPESPAREIRAYRCSCGTEWKLSQKEDHRESCASFVPPKVKPKRKRKQTRVKR